MARNLAAAAAWSAFWLSRFGVALIFEATGALPPLAQVAVYAVLGVGPVAYLLAEAVVVLVASAGPETAPGKAGAAFAASTLGNVAGGLATALVVMQHVGVAGSVALVSGLLVVAALAAWERPGWRLWAAGVVVAAVAGATLAVECVRRPHGASRAPSHARVLRPGALAARRGRHALREPHRRACTRPAVHARGPDAALGVRGVLDAGARGGVSMAQPGVRVPADRARRRRHGVLGRERARGHRRGAGGAF
ncbi:MAG: hypothetical protein F4169_07340 [Gammaproteobacteria bacterium]|nr:hypothetical protein [Gammaproteobacteria bacterium]